MFARKGERRHKNLGQRLRQEGGKGGRKLLAKQKASFGKEKPL